MPEVSVVVPVYNTETYVEEALRSVMGQSLADIEIIVVDDGSTDGSPAVLERLAREDSRIRIHTQPNKGLSEARNAGIARATGRYLYFMDSDDLLESDALELCRDKCDAQRLDFVFFDADTFGADVTNCPWFDYHRAAAFEDRVYTGPELLGAMLSGGKYIASACLYMIRTGFLMQHRLSFYPGILHEDELFTTEAYLAAERAGRIERSFFKRRLRPDSIMGRPFSERNLEGYLTVLREIRKYAAGRGAEARRLAERFTAYTLRPVLRNAWNLPAGVRLRLAGTALMRHTRAAGIGDIAFLLFKSPVKKLRGR